MNKKLETIRLALTEETKGLMKKSNVVAVGIGYKTVDGKTTDELSIICSVETDDP